jgi:hypothetical protein
VESERELAVTAEQIAREMRSQYVLGYSPGNFLGDGIFHKVRLQLRPAGSGFSIYWRRGFRSPLW